MVCGPPSPLLTSAPGTHFRRLVRKFYSLRSCRLPYQRPVFGVWDGSFALCALADFRIRGLFSAFGTEVSLPALLPTSVLRAHFRRLGRKFRFLHSCRLPYQRPIFGILYGSRSTELLHTKAASSCIFVFRAISKNSAFSVEISAFSVRHIFCISLSFLYEYQSDT